MLINSKGVALQYGITGLGIRFSLFMRIGVYWEQRRFWEWRSGNDRSVINRLANELTLSKQLIRSA